MAGPVQQAVNNKAASGTTLAITLGSNPTVGNFLVCCVSLSGTTVTVNSIATTGVTWTNVTSSRVRKGNEVWLGKSLTGTVGTVTTITASGVTNMAANVSEWPGATYGANPSSDGTPTANNGTSAAPTVGSVTNANATALFIACLSTATASVITPSNSFVALTNDQTQGSARIYPSYIEAVSSAARSTGWATSSNTWDMIECALSSSSSSNKTITGVRAAVTVTAKVGTPRVIVTGVRGAVSVAAKVGTPRVVVTGVRALATASAKVGTPTVSLLGVRAAVTVTAKVGTPRVIVTGVRGLGTAAAKVGTPLVVVTGARAAATAAAKVGTPRVIVTGTRALVSVTGKPGVVVTTTGGSNVTVTGVRAEATARVGGADTDSLTAAATVTTTGVNLGDGFLLAKGMLFSNAITARKLVKWANPSTDLATFTTLTYANDGKHGGSVGLVYDAGTDLIYHAFSTYVGGDDFHHILVVAIDPDDLTETTFVDQALYDSNIYLIGAGACNICTDGTHLYLITHTFAAFGPDTVVYKFLLADGSLVAQREITGKQHGHVIAHDGAGLLVGAGTSPANNGWAFTMADDLSSHTTVALASSTCTVCDDIVIEDDYFWLQDESKTNPARIWRVKKSDLSVNTITLTGGGTSAASDGFLDNISDDGTIWVGMRDGNAIATVNATTLVEGSAITTSGIAKINEIVRSGSDVYAATYEANSVVKRFTLASVPGHKGTPRIIVTGVRALVSATGRPGTVVATTGGSATIVGVRAAVSVTGRPGTPKVAVTGTRAALTAAATAGCPRVIVTGSRAAATATARPGTPRIVVTGSRALVTVTGRAGAASAPGNKTVTGVRASCTVTSTAGTPKVTVTGVRSSATAAARPGTPRVIVTGARALVTVTGKPGVVAVKSSPTITGVRAAATATGRVGTPKIAVTGTRAAATATGRPGTPRIIVVGARALVSCAGKTGTVYTASGKSIVGVRGVVYCRANPGAVGVPAESVLTRRTRTSGPGAVTILATHDGRTLVSAGSNRTVVGVRRVGGRVRVGAGRTDTYTPPTED